MLLPAGLAGLKDPIPFFILGLAEEKAGALLLVGVPEYACAQPGKRRKGVPEYPKLLAAP